MTLIEGVDDDRLKPTLSFEQFMEEHPELKRDVSKESEENLTPEERIMKQAMVDGFIPVDLPLKDGLPETAAAASDGVWYSFGVGRSMDSRRFGVCVANTLTDEKQAMEWQSQLGSHILMVQDPGEAELREVPFTSMCHIQVLCNSEWVCIPTPGNTVPARIQSMMEHHNQYAARMWNDATEKLKAKQKEGDAQFEQFAKEHPLVEGPLPEDPEDEEAAAEPDAGAVYDLPSLSDLKTRADAQQEQQQQEVTDAEKRMIVMNDANERNESTVVVIWFLCGDTRDAGVVMRIVGPFEDDDEANRAIAELGMLYPTAEIRMLLTNSFGVMDTTEDANWNLMKAMPHAHRVESVVPEAEGEDAKPKKKKKKGKKGKAVAPTPVAPPSIAIGGKPGFKLPKEADKGEWDKYDAFLSHAQRQYLRYCKENGIAPEALNAKPDYRMTATTSDGVEHVVDSQDLATKTPEVVEVAAPPPEEDIPVVSAVAAKPAAEVEPEKPKAKAKKSTFMERQRERQKKQAEEANAVNVRMGRR